MSKQNTRIMIVILSLIVIGTATFEAVSQQNKETTLKATVKIAQTRDQVRDSLNRLYLVLNTVKQISDMKGLQTVVDKKEDFNKVSSFIDGMKDKQGNLPVEISGIIPNSAEANYNKQFGTLIKKIEENGSKMTELVSEWKNLKERVEAVRTELAGWTVKDRTPLIEAKVVMNILIANQVEALIDKLIGTDNQKIGLLSQVDASILLEIASWAEKVLNLNINTGKIADLKTKLQPIVTSAAELKDIAMDINEAMLELAKIRKEMLTLEGKI